MNGVLLSAFVCIYISCFTQVIRVVQLQLRHFVQELPTPRSFPEDSLRNEDNLNLLFTPPEYRAEELGKGMKWRETNDVIGSTLFDGVQSVKAAANHTPPPNRELKVHLQDIHGWFCQAE